MSKLGSALVFCCGLILLAGCGNGGSGNGGVVNPPPVNTPNTLPFTVQPGNARATMVISPPIQVTLVPGNNTRPLANGPVTLTLNTHGNGAVLGGTTTVMPTNSVATFNDLTVSLPGQSYTLTASAPTFDNNTSTPFNITP